MKKFLLIALVTTQIFGAVSNGRKYKLDHQMGQAAGEAQLGTLIDEGGERGVVKDGHQAKTLAVATYDFSVLGGATTTSGGSSLGVTLPANAIITRSWVDVITPLVGSGSSISIGTKAVGDVMALATASGMTTQIEGVSTGTAATMKKMTADTTVKYVNYYAPLTAGKFKVYIEYVMSQFNGT